MDPPAADLVDALRLWPLATGAIVSSKRQRMRYFCGFKIEALARASQRIGSLSRSLMDVLEPAALCQIVKTLQVHPMADLIYSDEDKLTRCCEPRVYADCQHDLFSSHNYVAI